MEWLVEKRVQMRNKYKEVIEATGFSWLVPQHTMKGDINSCFTLAAKFENNFAKW